MSLEALERYARRRGRSAAANAEHVCELCAAPAGEAHPHVVDLQRRTLCCACVTCATLFVQGGGAGGRYRTVPQRVLAEPGFALAQAEWSELQIPVGLAFVFFSSAAQRWVALYPSPAGAMESELPLDAWRDLATRSALVASAEPDVEALLVHGERGAAALDCLLVPIDACYALVARIRRHWQGFDGGDAVRREVAAHIQALRARAAGARRRRSPGACRKASEAPRRLAVSDPHLDRARQIADAVLLEGYVLYPYRASSTKNRYRFTFGVLAPRAWSEAGGCEAWWLEAQCLVEGAKGAARGSEGAEGAELRGKLRFLQACRRQVEEADGSGTAFRRVDALDVEGRRLVSWDEGDLREIDLRHALAGGASVVPFELPGGSETELCRDAAGRVRARVVRERWPLRGAVRIDAEPAAEGGGRSLTRVRLRVENESPWDDPRARRDDAVRAACIASHLLLSVTGGAFVSLIDPPEWARAAAAACRNVRTFPVLAGAPGRHDLLLAAPIILYDHPQVAPESPGDLCDATEIDEILTLRTATLTDEEKRDARATDPRAADIVERVDRMPPELLQRLHGAARDLRRAAMVPRPSPALPGNDAAVAGIVPGSRVRLRPGVRRTDAQDLLYAGLTATVRLVRRDVDGRDCLAVTIDDDPAAELHDWYGRHHHYYLDEVEPLAPGSPERSASP